MTNQWTKLVIAAVTAGFLTSHVLRAEEGAAAPAGDEAKPAETKAKDSCKGKKKNKCKATAKGKDGCKGKSGCKGKDSKEKAGEEGGEGK